jgi:uncharacterized membrane protein HdeD (DUF308 family)
MAGDAKKLCRNALKMVIDVVILIIGIVLLAVPNVAMQTITVILGIVLLAYGGITTFLIFYKKDGRSPVVPIIFIVIGVLLLIFSNLFANTILPFAIGVWMLVMGIVSLAGSRGMGKLPMIMSVIAIVLGVIILIGVFVGANIMAVLLGVCMLIYGVTAVIDFIAMRGRG